MKKILFTLIFCFLASNGFALPYDLFSAALGTPEQQGWRSESDYTDGEATINCSDTLNCSTTGSAINLYGIDTFAESFYCSMRVALVYAGHNWNNAGFIFSPGCIRRMADYGNPPNPGNWPLEYVDRLNALYITPLAIGFNDDGAYNTPTGIQFHESGVAYAMNTTGFHEYSMLYLNNYLGYYVDTSFADIMMGIATPVLSRYVAMEPNSFYLPGQIHFGDHTNDTDCNSSYELDYIKFEEIGQRNGYRYEPPAQSITPVPEPSSGILLCTGLLAIAGYVGKRKNGSRLK